MRKEIEEKFNLKESKQAVEETQVKVVKSYLYNYQLLLISATKLSHQSFFVWLVVILMASRRRLSCAASIAMVLPFARRYLAYHL